MKKQKPKLVKWKFPTHLAADIVKIVASHPVTLGLGIMAASALGMSALAKTAREPQDSRAKDLYHQLAGLYQGAQGIATAAVVVPIVVSGIQAAATMYSSRQTAKTPVAGEVPST